MSVFRFLRRPFLRGNTNSLVQGAPSLRSDNRRSDATLSFGFVTPATLSVRVDGTLRVVALASAAINDIVTALNTPITGLIDATASDEGGFLVITGNSVGDGAQLRVESSAPAVDAAVDMGFPTHPDPLATSDGGDRSFSPAGLSENNPLGTYYATGGEDVTSGVMNRAIDALAYNGDYLAASLDRLIALPMVIDEIDPTVSPWNAAGRAVFSGTAVEQINLGDLSTIDSGLSDRVYLGKGLSNISNLNDIADYFAVIEEDTLSEMVVGGVTVRVACVTHGQRSVSVPTFDAAGNLLAGAVPDVATWTPLDGGNLLGLNFQKTVAAGIDEVVYNTAIRVLGATFQTTAGVETYDRVVIAGAGVNAPFNHDGTYQVEAVYSDEMLLLRGATPQDRGELNDALGVLGTAEVWANSEFATDVWLTFDPPIPAGKTFRVIVGGGYQLGTMPTDYLLKLAISTSEEVDSLIQQVIREMKGPLVNSTDDFTEAPFAHSVVGNPFVYSGPLDGSGDPLISLEFLHRRTTLQGAYDGQGLGGGGGFFVNVDWNAPEWNNQTPSTPRGHTAVGLTGTAATVLAGNVFFDPGQAFTIDDVGRQILITSKVSGAVRLRAAFVVIDYINSETVVLEPGEWNPTIPLGGDYGYSVVTGRFDGFPAAMSTHVLQSASYGRLGYVHEEDRTVGRFYGHHMLAVREATTHSDGAEPADLLRHFVVEFISVGLRLAADGWVQVGFDPSASSNIRAFGGIAPSYSQSVIRLTDTENNDGWYLVTDIDGAAQSLRVMNFDGTHPAFAASAADGGRGHLYTQRQGTSLTRVGHSFFEDAIELNETVTAPDTISQLGVVGVDWRGASNGFFAYINDSDFAAYIRGDSARGSAAYFSSYMPANGLESWHTGSIVGTNLAPGGAAIATAAERGGWAGAFVAETWSMAGTSADPLMRGTSLYLAQKGSDSALVAVGREGGGAHSDPLSPDDLTFVDGKATAVIVREDEWSMMQGGALEIMGGVYQWDPNSFWPGGGNLSPRHMYGGVYTELAMGSRFSNSPIHANSLRYYDVAEDSGQRILARLGQPGQTHPYYHADADLVIAIVAAPDPARSRSHRSSGFITLDFAAPSRFEHPSTYIGQQLDVTFDGGANVGNSGVYVIINFRVLDDVGTPLKFAYTFEVLHETLTLVNEEPPGAHKVLIRGGRWHWANIDIESWMAIGTYRTADPARVELDEFLGCGVLGTPDVNMIDLGEVPSGMGQPGMLSDPSVGLNDYAFGLGTDPTAAGLVSPDNFVARPPIANAAFSPFGSWTSVSNPDELFDSSIFNTTTFLTSEWVLRQLALTSVLRAGFDFRDVDNDIGGAVRHPALMFHWAGGVANVDKRTVRALTRVTHTIREHHFRLRVRATMRWVAQNSAPGATKNITAELRDADETSIVSTTHADTLIRNTTTDLDFFLAPLASLAGLREAAPDTLSKAVQAILNFNLGETRMDAGGESVEEKLFIYSCHVTMEAVDVHHGALINEGPVISSGFHLSGAALDYKSYGPADAAPYGDSGFGAEAPWWFRGRFEDGTRVDGKIDPPSIRFISGSRLRLVAAAPPGPWQAEWAHNENLFDMMPPSFFWRRGANDACFYFLGDRFVAGEGDRAGGQEPSSDTATQPFMAGFSTMVGHSIRLDPPHGSLMSTLRVAASVFSAVTLGMGVYRSAEPCDTDPLKTVKPADPGFVIELLRHSILPIETRPSRKVGGTDVAGWEFGHAEVIGRFAVDSAAAGTASQADAMNTSAEYDCDGLINRIASDGIGEIAHLVAIDLMGEYGGAAAVVDKNMLFVDRRQYAYSLTVRAWGRGMADLEIFSTGAAVGAQAGQTFGLASSSDGAHFPTELGDISKLKFRGATLACAYTRMNP